MDCKSPPKPKDAVSMLPKDKPVTLEAFIKYYAEQGLTRFQISVNPLCISDGMQIVINPELRQADWDKPIEYRTYAIKANEAFDETASVEINRLAVKKRQAELQEAARVEQLKLVSQSLLVTPGLPVSPIADRREHPLFTMGGSWGAAQPNANGDFFPQAVALRNSWGPDWGLQGPPQTNPQAPRGSCKFYGSTPAYQPGQPLSFWPTHVSVQPMTHETLHDVLTNSYPVQESYTWWGETTVPTPDVKLYAPEESELEDDTDERVTQEVCERGRDPGA